MTQGKCLKVMRPLIVVVGLVMTTGVVADASREITIAIGGDLLGPYRPVTRPVTRQGNPGFAAVRRIMSDADVALANFEASAFDLRTFQGWPAPENGGGTPLFAPDAIAELATWIDGVSVANNHATDWGLQGLLATRRTLNQAGIVTAGSGGSEAEARAAAYLTVGSARIALVAAASTFTDLSLPSAPGDKNGMPTRARPGINTIRRTEIRIAPREIIEAIRPLKEHNFGPPSAPDEIQIGSEIFRVGERIARTYEANMQDEQRVIASVASAQNNADIVVFSIHAHETASGDGDDLEPAAFQRTLFHKAIDAGADLVFRHGPHVVGGIEIYKGRPILYSMGSLVFQFGGQRRLTWPSGFTLDLPDTWFESAVITTSFRDGELDELRIHPLMIESSTQPSDGLPMPATGEDARRILERIQGASAQWGTRMIIQGDSAVIRMGEHRL